MKNLFDRGWFRDSIYKTNEVKELIELIIELDKRLKILVQQEDYKILSDPEKTKVLDQYKTAMNVCWDKIKVIISNRYLYITEEEKYLHKVSKEERELLRKEKEEIVDELFDKEHFNSLLNDVKYYTEYLTVMNVQFTLLRYALISESYMSLHPYNKRKEKDLYFSSINECWKLFSEGLQKEYPLLSESKRKEQKANHIRNRRKRHEERSERKREWKEEKLKKINEMMQLSEDEFNKVQNELEAEYRKLRNLPEKPEV